MSKLGNTYQKGSNRVRRLRTLFNALLFTSLKFAIFFLLVLPMFSCNTSPSESNKVRATRLLDDEHHFRVKIYNSVEEVSQNFLAKIFSICKGETQAGSEKAKEAATKICQMHENMMRSPTNPIHPIAFYSVVKDAESSADIDNWGNGKFNFTTGNCTSGVCSGYFQVDVHKVKRVIKGKEVMVPMLPVFREGKICEEMGVWNIKGGPDFCAALVWWIFSVGPGNALQCARMNGVKTSYNPCTDKDYTWDLNTFHKGYKAYGQQPQWKEENGVGGWARMYKRYEAIAKANHDKNLVAAVDAFKAKIGLSSPQQNCQNTPANSAQTESGNQTPSNSNSGCQESQSQIASTNVKTDLFTCTRDTCPQGEEELVKKEFVPTSNAGQTQTQTSTNEETPTSESTLNPSPESEIGPTTNSESQVDDFFQGLDSQTTTPDVQQQKEDPEIVPEDQRYKRDPTIRSVF